MAVIYFGPQGQSFVFLVVTCPRPPPFATQPRAFILSDRNIFYTLPGKGGEQRRGLMPLGLFLVFFFGWSLALDLQFSLGQTNTSCRRSVNINTIFSRNLHEKRCRKLLAMQWHKTLFDESEDEDASKL